MSSFPLCLVKLTAHPQGPPKGPTTMNEHSCDEDGGPENVEEALYDIEVSRCLPDILYLEADDHPYRVGYRQPRHDRESLLVRGGTLVTGKHARASEVWVCLDLSNGNPEMLTGRIYVWVHPTLEEAKQRMGEHALREDLTRLLGPYPCLLVQP